MKKIVLAALFILGIIFLSLGITLEKTKGIFLLVPQKSALIPASKSIPTISQDGNSDKGEAVVAYILDGDTIETLSKEKIRYLGINAPERGQPFSSQATLENKALVLGKRVNLEFDILKKDRYGRLLAYVFTGNTFVNLEMVKKGLAVSETIQPNVKYQNEILAAQKEARGKCLGIWKSLCGGISSAGCVKVIYINANASGNDNQNKNEEWVKISNACSYKVSMDGWLLKDSSASNKYEFHNFTLNSDKSVMLYSGCGQNSQDKLYWQCPESRYAVWNNAGDHAFLYNNKGELVSDYQY